MSNIRVKDLATTATSPAADDVAIIDGATGTRKIAAGPLGGNFDENIVVENGGNKTTYASNFLRSENGAYYIDAYTTGGDILFRTSVASALDTTSMIIDGATGRVAIGLSSPDAKLHVANSAASGGTFKFVDGSSRTLQDLSGGALSWSAASVIGGTSWSGTADHEIKTLTTARDTLLVTGPASGSEYGLHVTGLQSLFDGKLGIGVSPGDYFSNANALVVGTGADAHQGITIATNSDGGGHLYFMDGVAAAPGRISYYHTGNNMLFYANDSERLRLTSDGCLGVGLSTVPSLHKLMVQPTDGVNFSVSNNGSALRLNAVNNDASGNCAAEFTASSYNFIGGNVGIGVSPDKALTVKAGTINTDIARLTGANDDRGLVISTAANGITNDATVEYDAVSGASAGQHVFKTDGTTRLTLDESGNLEFSSGADILMPDNNGAALEIKEGANPFLRFITTNGGEKIEVYKETHHSANIVMGNNLGIDFSATADGSGTMTSELLDSYEEGSWVPTFGATSGSYTTLTMDVVKASYTRVGRLVSFFCYIRTDDVDTTGTGGHLTVGGLPFANAGSDSYVPINVGFANFWTNAPAGGYVYTGADYIILAKRLTSITGALTGMAATADLTSGTTANQNQLMISGSYYTA